MNKTKLAKCDVAVSEIVLGTWVMGDDEYWGHSDELESIKAIQTAYEGGVTTFDTAFAYGNGKSEKLLGKAIKKMPREQITVFSKLWRKDMTRDRVIPACEKSLRFLGLDYMDTYFIHYPSDSGVPIGETMEELMLSYAITVHKSQGCEFDAAVIVLTGGSYMINTRNLLYTALTRAKSYAVLIGERETVRKMVNNTFTQTRYTMLREMLEAYSEKLEIFS